MFGSEKVKDVVLPAKRVLITGGTTGIGRATALYLAAQGAQVFIFGRHKKELKDALADLAEVSPDAAGIAADVTLDYDIERVFEAVDQTMGGIDVLINNAAIGASDLLSVDKENIRYVIATDVVGYMQVAKEAIVRMEKQGYGHIINIGSMSAVHRRGGDEVYAAAKAAIQVFSESLRKSVAAKGIKVTLIEPGLVGTDMQTEIPPKKQRKMETRETMLLAEDVTHVINYLLTLPRRIAIESLRVVPFASK
jgi:NAD(P)-dependent dehydrogenase (short-subunit alcohol dehydrogenase family)